MTATTPDAPLRDAPDELDFRAVLAIFWRSWPYIRPSMRHLVQFVLWSGVAFVIGAGLSTLLIYLATVGIMSAEPLSGFYVWLYGLDPERFQDVQVLSADARRDLKWPTVYTAIVAALVAIAALSLLRYYSVWIFQAINQRMRIDLIDKLLAQSLGYHASAQTGDAIYRVYQDSAMVTAIIRSIFVEPVMFAGRYFAGLAIVAFFSPSLALIVAFTALPVILLGRWFSARLRSKFRRVRERNAALTSWIQESVLGVRVIKATGGERARKEAFDDRSGRAFAAAFDSRVSLNLMGIYAFAIIAVATLAVQTVAASFAHQEASTFARDILVLFGFAVWNFGTFSAANSRTGDAIGSVSELITLWGRAQDMAVGLGRVFEIMDLEPGVLDAPGAVAMPPFEREVLFSGVSFGYIEGRRVIAEVDLTAPAGSITAIVGPTGTGKSTLMSLLLRLADPDSGSITIDGADIRSFTLDSLRSNISIATQENVLFTDTVLENIRYAAPGASRADAEAAARVACAHDFIMALPDGYDTPLGERASKLSSGQRQRLVLARAIVRDTPILILDEPTAALDAEMELKVLDNLREWGRGRCVFLITHRLSTVQRADRVIYLREGRVIADGDHDQLVAVANGAYRRFVAAETGAS